MVKIKDFSRPLGVYPVLFKAKLILRTFQDRPVYSSTVRTLVTGSYTNVDFLIFAVVYDLEIQRSLFHLYFQYICEEHFQKLSGGRSVFTTLKAATHFGRPHLTSMFQTVHKTHPLVSFFLLITEAD